MPAKSTGRRSPAERSAIFLFEMEANADFNDVQLDAMAMQTLSEESGADSRVGHGNAAKRKHSMSR